MDRGKRSEPAELLAIVLLGFLLRLFAGRSSLTENGILLPGYDEFYHMRRIFYTANHFPDALWFDSYLNYPHGLFTTWPPLFDQISATLCVVLGQHTKAGVEMVSSFVPVLAGVLAIIAVYFIVRELFDHRVALLASFLTALAPNFILKTMFAGTDHHSLEVLLQLLTLLFIIMAYCRRDKRYLFACAAGVAMAALAYTWQGADIYLGIFLIYAAVRMTLDLKDERPSTDTATILLIAFVLALIIVLPFWNTSWLSPSFLGIAAMIVALSIMFALSRFMEMRKISWKMFPLSILVLVIAFILSAKFTGLFGLGALIQYGLDYIWGGGMIGKIGEAEPLVYDARTFYQVVFSWLGLNLLLSLAGIAASIDYIRRSTGGIGQGRLLLLVWGIFTLILTFGQTRFLYISIIAMGVLISILFFWVVEMADRKSREGQKKAPKGWAAILLLLLITPMVAEAVNVVYYMGGAPPDVAGDWQQSLVWLKENSDTTSYYELPENVPEYSVMSWWDYGNWIVYLAERPVVANNFQAGAEDAARFYLSESEENATEVLDARRSRFILVDFDLVYGKLPALTTWANEDISSYMRMEEVGSQIAAIPEPRLFNTTLGRLYLFDGAGTGRFRLIHESGTFIGGGDNPSKSEVKIFEYVPGALIRVRTGMDQKVGALLNITSNQGRAFNYVNEATLTDGAFEIRVPYSTEARYGTQALDPYLVFSGNEGGVKMQNLNVSEEDVLAGRTIDMTF